MFNLPFDDTGAEVNSHLNMRDMGNGSNSKDNRMMNCPTILTGNVSRNENTHEFNRSLFISYEGKSMQ
jgi:hypothetical protein